MATAIVRITKAGRSDAYGIPLAVGSSYSLDTWYAQSLVSQGFAAYTTATADPSLAPITGLEVWRGDTNLPAYSNVASAAATAVSAGGMYGPSRQLIVALGDSLQGNGISIGVTPQINAPAAINWGMALIGQALWMPFGCSSSYVSGPADIVNYNLAVSGSTSYETLGGETLQPGSPAAAAVALGAGWWSVQTGTNDVSLRPGDTANDICNRLRKIVEAGLAAGARVALWTIPPRQDSSGAGNWQSFSATIVAAGSTVANQRLKQMVVNAWIRQYCQQTNGVYCIDPYFQLVDTASATASPITAYFADGVHWNSAGAFIGGQVFAAVIGPLVKPAIFSSNDQIDIYSAVNVTGNTIPTPGLIGTGGSVGGTGVSGSPPTGWTLDIQTGTLTPGTAVAATQARTDFVTGTTLQNGRELQVTVAGTPPGAFQLRAYQATSTTIPANTPFYAEYEMVCSATTASWSGPSIQAFINSGAVNSIGMASDGASLPAGSTFKAVIRTPIMRHTAPTNGLIFAQLNGLASSQFVAKIVRVSLRPLASTSPGTLLGSA